MEITRLLFVIIINAVINVINEVFFVRSSKLKISKKAKKFYGIHSFCSVFARRKWNEIVRCVNFKELHLLRIDCHFKKYTKKLSKNHKRCATCVLNKNARAISKIFCSIPSSGPYSTIKYVNPNNGMRTSKAFDAFRYWRVSAVFADRNFVMSTYYDLKLM